jgi:hypothetical protein
MRDRPSARLATRSAQCQILDGAGGKDKSFFPGDFQYKVLSVADSMSQDLSPFFQETSAFIRQGVQAGGVQIDPI